MRSCTMAHIDAPIVLVRPSSRVAHACALCVLIVGLRLLLQVVINVAIGLAQEGKAEKAAEAIKAMMSSTATVSSHERMGAALA